MENPGRLVWEAAFDSGTLWVVGADNKGNVGTWDGLRRLATYTHLGFDVERPILT